MKSIFMAVLVMFGLMGVAQAEGVYQCNSIVMFKDNNGEDKGEPKKMKSTIIDKESSFVIKNSGGALMSGVLVDTGVRDKEGNVVYGSSQQIENVQAIMFRSRVRDTLVWFVHLKDASGTRVVMTYEIDCVKQ